MGSMVPLSSERVVDVPADMRFDDDAEQVEELLNKDPHIGYLIGQLEIAHEARHDGLVAQKKSEIEVMKQNNLQINEFLGALGTELSDPSKTTIDMTHHAVLMGELARKYPHKLLEKNKITRDEAKALEQAFGRHMQLVTQEISHEITRLTRLVEEKYQNTKLFQQLLEMLRNHGQTLTRNQRAG